jgi:hypothetical protein
MSRVTNPEVPSTSENSKKWSPNYGSGGSMKVEIKPFDEKINFGLWQRRMRGVLIQQRLQVALEDRPEGMSDPEWSDIDQRAISTIEMYITDDVLNHVISAISAKDMWEKLEAIYLGKSLSNKLFLKKKLFKLEMKEGEDVMKHINSFNALINDLSRIDVQFSEEDRALLLLASFPDSYEHFVTTLMFGKTTLKFNEIVQDIISHVTMKKADDKSTSGSALNVESRGRNSNRGSGRGRSKSRSGRSKSRYPRNSNGQSSSKTIECWNCGKTGHYKNQCKAPKKEKESDSANVVADGEALILSVDSPLDSWVLDSGASFHTTAIREILENYVSGDFGKVYLADGTALDVVGIGNVKIRIHADSVWKLQKVRHVPELKKNLISVGQLDDEGHGIHFHGGKWKVSMGARIIALGEKTGTLYMTTDMRDTIAVADASAEADLWHQRLGHMSEKGLKVMHSLGKLPKLKSVNIDFCENCIFGKQKRVSFKTGGRTLRNEKLELVHTDVWGPAAVSSIGGKSYFVTFIDDHSRKVWVYFLKQKSEVYEVFKKWKAMVENETGLKIKKLRSDNGGEYEDTGFKRFCFENGIRLERTVPGTPQQNGVAERMNRTLTERARSMRIQSGLPKQFWAEAINTAAYLINRGPSVPLEQRIPEEVWSGKEVNLSWLKVFGCIAYVHISDHARGKLDPKSLKCTFIGYGGDEFGYRLWDDQNKKIIRSRDVIFNEKLMYKDRSTAQSTSPVQNDPVSTELADLSDSSVAQQVGEDPQPEEPTEQQAPQNPTPMPAPRRSARPHVPNRKYMNFLLLTDGGEPECYDEACQVEDSSKWELAMKDEMKSLISNNTWELAELPVGKKALHNKWVYRVKEEHNGSKRHKARLVVKGFQQKEGIDYTDIFSPVVKLNTIRSVLSIVAAEGLHLEQLDVKTAFLHGDLDEEIYMQQPEGFSVKGKEKLVCRLTKSLYGLKQAPRQWYKKFDGFMQRHGYNKCNADHCCYFKRFESSYIILLLYVDDMLVAGPDMDEIQMLKKQLSREFDMKDLGAAKQILGMRINRDKQKGTLQLSQEEYIDRILKRFSMSNAKPVSTPLASHFRLSKDQSPKTEEEKDFMAKVPYASAIGSLMYAMVCTRPDIAHAVGAVSRFMTNPGKQHWEAVKWILRYLRGTTDRCLCFRRGELKLQGFVDADFAAEVDHRRSTTGYVFTVGTTAVSWISQIQKIVALSTTEAEYIAVTEASKEMIWLQGLLAEMGFKQEKNVLHSDSQSAIHLAKNSAFHSRTKHIGLRYHFVRSLLEDGVLTLEKIQGSKNPADMLTKTVTIEKLKLCSTSVGLQA